MWSWTAPSATSGDILKIFYVYSLDDSPPHYVLMVQYKDGRTERLSKVNPSKVQKRFDKEALEEARQQPDSVPVQVQHPLTHAEKKSCSIQ